MFVRNPNKIQAHLARGWVTDDLAVAALVVPQTYRITAAGLVPLPSAPEPALHDPPDTSTYALWDGVSVTVAGHVEGPSRPPFARLVELRVGDAVRRMAVFGDRVWERSILGGGLAASDPRPFDRLELSVERAFGGGFDVPPGLLPGLNLPHPGYRYDHRFNPKGVGFYPDERTATGAPLPNFERPEALLRRWNDAPLPVAFSPCRELVAWRNHAFAGPLLQEHMARGGSAENVPMPPPELLFRALHHAPPELIFDDVPVGTRIEIEGLSAEPLRASTPGCLARLEIQPSSNAVVERAPRLRSIHIDADRGLLVAVHSISFRYQPRRAPRRVRVLPVNGGQAWDSTAS